MKGLWKFARFSGIGVFFAGIIGIIQGCSLEREGFLFAFLIFFLNFCAGPQEADMGSPGISPQPGIQFADFSDGTPRTISQRECESNAGGTAAGGSMPETLPNMDGIGISFSPVDTNGGDGEFSLLIDNGMLTITTTGECNTDSAYVSFFSASLNDGLDLSLFDAINVRVTQLTGGPVTGCQFVITDSTNNPGITTATFDLTEGDNVISISGGVNMHAMQGIRFGYCDFAGPTTLVIKPFHILGGLPGVKLTDFSSNTPASLGPVLCNSMGAVGGAQTISELLPNLDRRELGYGGLTNKGAGTIEFEVNNGEFEIEAELKCKTSGTYIKFFDSNNANSVDFSSFSKVHIRVKSITGGTVTDCQIAIWDNVGNEGILSAPFDLVVGDITVPIAGGVNMNAMDAFAFGFCDFESLTSTTVVLAPFYIE